MPEESTSCTHCYYKDAVSLKQHVDDILKANKEQVAIARESMEKRLDGMNEFRETLRDQAKTFVTRTEW